MFSSRGFVIGFVALLGMALPVYSQEKKEAQEPPIVENFWLGDAGLGIQAAAQVIAPGNAHGALGVRMLVTQYPLLDKWQFVFDEPLPLSQRFLEAIKDRRPLPVIQLTKNVLPPIMPEFEKVGSSDWGWYRAFNEALRRSDEADLEMFKKGAEKNKHVVYSHLTAAPAQHRGKILTVKGKLLVIRRQDPPRFVPDNIENVYTGYIAGPTQGAPPFTVTFTELPLGVEPAEKLNLEVTFYGYFLSLVRFPADKGAARKQEDVISPYLVGKTLIVNPAEKVLAEEKTAYSYDLIVWTVGGIVGIAILVALLNLWFKRGDRRIQSQLAAMRAKAQPFNLEPADPDVPAETPPDPTNGAPPKTV